MQVISDLASRLILVITSLLFADLCNGQDHPNPSIPTTGPTLTAFIPKGWKLLDSASGDLNKDGWEDVAMAIETIDSVKVSEFDEDYKYPSRNLLILWGQPQEGYKLAARNNRLIAERDSPHLDEPLKDIRIKNGILKLSFTYWYSMGTWSVSSYEYVFRFQQGQFTLIGAEMESYHRGSGESETYSYNFSTKKRSYTVENEKGKKTTWKNITLDKLKTLDDPAIPYQWKVEEGVIL